MVFSNSRLLLGLVLKFIKNREWPQNFCRKRQNLISRPNTNFSGNLNLKKGKNWEIMADLATIRALLHH